MLNFLFGRRYYEHKYNKLNMLQYGDFDIFQLHMNTIDMLLEKKLINADDAKKILRKSLSKRLSESKKTEIIDSMLKVIPIKGNSI